VLAVAAEIRTYSTGRYGIVDLYYRHIWINHWNEDIIHEVRRAFWSKVTTIVFDLSWFNNYSDQTVDSDVSLNWKIPICSDLRSSMLKMSLRNPVLFSTQTQYESKLLLNESTCCNLTTQQQKELQNQMLLLISVLECIRFIDPKSNCSEEMISDIRNIFLSEITTDAIRKRLYELASDRIESPTDHFSKILKLLGKLYA
jgi:hypothetical protein